MQLGAFSVSLTVKNLNVSKDFYEKLGFTVFAGDLSERWLILKNEDCLIGLFEGLFDRNVLTFCPGWNNNAEQLKEFTDVRQLQKQLKKSGIKMSMEVESKTKGPGSCMIFDPDGNPILLDQHV